MANQRYALEKVLTAELLGRLAGANAYERGANYWQSGKVLTLTRIEETLSARVAGTRSYDIAMWVRAGRLQYTCNCLAAAEGACCKHCVAVGLQWINEAKG